MSLCKRLLEFICPDYRIKYLCSNLSCTEFHCSAWNEFCTIKFVGIRICMERTRLNQNTFRTNRSESELLYFSGLMLFRRLPRWSAVHVTHSLRQSVTASRDMEVPSATRNWGVNLHPTMRLRHTLELTLLSESCSEESGRLWVLSPRLILIILGTLLTERRTVWKSWIRLWKDIFVGVFLRSRYLGIVRIRGSLATRNSDLARSA